MERKENIKKQYFVESFGKLLKLNFVKKKLTVY